MLQITNQKTLTDLSDTQITQLRKQWSNNRAIILPQLIEPNLLEHVRHAIKYGEFHKVKHAGVDATELTLKHGPIINLLEMMASDPTFSKVISKITDKKPVGCFQGRIYNIRKSDHDDWHQDTGYNYLMAMSINLSPKPYKGGSLCVRDVNTKKVFADIHNIGPGDALIFDISKTLEHKIAPVTGAHPKIAFAGWFWPVPNYKNYMDKIIHKVIKKSKSVRGTSSAPEELQSAKQLSSNPVSVSKSVASRRVGTKTFLVDLKDESQYVLNEMGSAIWESICNGKSREQAIETLQKTYRENPETLSMEYQELLEDLIHVSIIARE